MGSYREGRFLEGWGAAGNGTALAWAAGLGKLGGVGEGIVGGGAGYREKVERENRLRTVRRKSCLTGPPSDGREFGERVRLL